MARQVEVHVSAEIVSVTEGVWCRPCALPSGVLLVWTMAIGPSMSLRETRWCRECGGREVDPPERA